MLRTSRRFVVVLGIAVLSTLPSSLPLHAQSTGSSPKGQVSEADAQMKGMQGKMQGMRAKMMADMKAQDGRIAALLAQMNSATGAGKTDAIAQLLNAMVQQNKSMRDHMDAMMQMHDSMMMQMMPSSGRRQ
jgi:hypothetical protein